LIGDFSFGVFGVRCVMEFKKANAPFAFGVVAAKTVAVA
jgi:hypothetical protein